MAARSRSRSEIRRPSSAARTAASRPPSGTFTAISSGSSANWAKSVTAAGRPTASTRSSEAEVSPAVG